MMLPITLVDVQVVHHCHVSGVIHRDIKPENFLLTTEKDDAELEACDFGLSAYFRPGQRFTQLIGSAYYVVRLGLECNCICQRRAGASDVGSCFWRKLFAGGFYLA